MKNDDIISNDPLTREKQKRRIRYVVLMICAAIVFVIGFVLFIVGAEMNLLFLTIPGGIIGGIGFIVTIIMATLFELMLF